jgi:CheY-like chemotaxis protein
MVRKAVGRLLEEEGYTVSYAIDGNEAFAKLDSEQPDAILLDVMMPGMNGREFLQALRQRGEREIPVVVMTAIHGIESQPVFALGASDLVKKPFDVDELLNKIALALFRSKNKTDAPAKAPEPEETGAPETDDDREGVVLVIDDDRLTLRRLDALLNDRGYTTVSLLRVTEELPRLARVLEPRAILLDLRLPGIDGLTALRWLRDEHTLDSVPILVFSGSDEELELNRAEIEALAASVGHKPLEVDDLVAFVTSPPAEAARR